MKRKKKIISNFTPRKRRRKILSDYDKSSLLTEEFQKNIFVKFSSIRNPAVKERFLLYLTGKISEMKKTIKKRKNSSSSKKNKKKEAKSKEPQKSAIIHPIFIERNKRLKKQRRKRRYPSSSSSSSSVNSNGSKKEKDDRIAIIRGMEKKLLRVRVKMNNMVSMLDRSISTCEKKKTQEKIELTINQANKLKDAINTLIETSEEVFDTISKVEDARVSQIITETQNIETINFIASYYFDTYKHKSLFSHTTNSIGSDLLKSGMIE